MKSFGDRALIRCLSNLGFQKQPQVGSRHWKFKCPKKHKAGERPFVEVLQGKTEYDRITQSKIISNLKKHGFTLGEIIEAFR
ncbi:hypothetical protein HY947_04285 [Candidatus Gottesmanbacteria bacterium]|nr:hypothetical protein [Candidatus Gottesmanbacteria bacterium]